MKEIKGILFIFMELVIIFVTVGIIYTLIFIDSALIAYPEYVSQIQTKDLSYGLVIALVTSLLSTGLLIYNQYRVTFRKKYLYLLSFISGYLFLTIQGTLLYGKAADFTSWISTEFYIFYFGLYKANVSNPSYQFFYDNIYISILYSLLFIIVILSVWKGRFGTKEKY